MQMVINMSRKSNTQSSVLEVFNIGKRYKNRSVLRNVSLNVRRGEAVGLLGPNGAGKTTCFYCVTGLITPDYGDVHIDGEDITYMPMYKRARMGIGYLPQEASIFRNLSVEDNIRAVLEIVVSDKEERESGRSRFRSNKISPENRSFFSLFPLDNFQPILNAV